MTCLIAVSDVASTHHRRKICLTPTNVWVCVKFTQTHAHIDPNKWNLLLIKLDAQSAEKMIYSYFRFSSHSHTSPFSVKYIHSFAHLFIDLFYYSAIVYSPIDRRVRTECLAAVKQQEAIPHKTGHYFYFVFSF